MQRVDQRYPLFVVDLEATCDDGGRVPRHEMEIIEIGGVLVEPVTLRVLDELQTFVRPVRNPVLTAFCTGLTSIRQSQVEGAPTFPEANAAMAAFLGDRKVTFCSWGNYDRGQFEQDAAFHRVRLPFDVRRHVNLKAVFSEALGNARGFGLGGALRHVGLTFSGTPHRGIDDARNIVRLLPWILGQQALPPPSAAGGGEGRGRGRPPRR